LVLGGSEIHAQKLKETADRLLAVVGSLKDTDWNAPDLAGFVRTSTGYVHVTRGPLREIRRIAEDLLQQGNWSQKFSESFFLCRGLAVVGPIRQRPTPSDAVRLISDIGAEFDRLTTPRTIFVPLGGLSVTDEIKAGRVTLGKLPPAIATSAHNTVARINALSPLQQAIDNGVYAGVDVVAEPTRAREIAVEETRRVIDVLRFTTPFLFPRVRRILVGLADEVPSSERFDLSQAPGSQTWSFSSASSSPVGVYDVNPAAMRTWHELGVPVLFGLLGSTTKPSDFDDAILRAVHWFANSTIPSQAENEILNLVTTLEVFLNPREEKTITSAVSEGVALVLGDSLYERRELKRLVKSFYKARSKISHGARPIVTGNQVRDFQMVVGAFLRRMISRRSEFKSLTDLEEWLDDQRLSAP
jgi:hypothetical protein